MRTFNMRHSDVMADSLLIVSHLPIRGNPLKRTSLDLDSGGWWDGEGGVPNIARRGGAASVAGGVITEDFGCGRRGCDREGARAVCRAAVGVAATEEEP